MRATRALILRIGLAVMARAVYGLLAVRNRLSRRPVNGSADHPVVSLTSYGSRIRGCHIPIEAIARGTMRPSRLILWLEDEEVVAAPPAPLRRLQSRGLEIRLTEDLGPHKKYYPAIEDPAVCAGRPLVTADDDILYPRSWLAELSRIAERHPGQVVCYRAHTIGTSDGAIAPYIEWLPRRSAEPGKRVFATGVSGVLYPTVMQAALRTAGTRFTQQAPRADDIWLHAVALRHGIPVRQAGTEQRHFLVVPGSQVETLQTLNIASQGNDRQIGSTYSAAEVAELVQDASSVPLG